MSHLSPSHGKQHLQQDQEQQQLQEGAESLLDDNPNPNSNSCDGPRNRPVLIPHSENPTAVETSAPQSGLGPDHPQRIEAQIEDQEVEDLESEGMPVSPTPLASATDSPAIQSYKRGRKRKKFLQKGRQRKQAAVMKKFESLNKNLNPIPFVPSKTLDFSKHEECLKRLGLWEFAHIEFDKSLKVDIIAMLIASYNAKDRGGYIHDCKIPVNRADLGRALKLNIKKSMDCDVVQDWPKDFVSFVDEFVSTWMLLHGDPWLVPKEVVPWTHLIKEGRLEKVDWAGLIWFMVEKELAQGPNLGDCYYASHLQHLIKVHKEELLREEPMEKEDACIAQMDRDADVKIVDSQVSKEGEDVVDQKMTVEQGTGVEVNMALALGRDAVTETAGAEPDTVSDMEVGNHADGDDTSDNLKARYNANNQQNVCGVDQAPVVDAANVENVDNADNCEDVGAADDNVKTLSTAHNLNNVTTTEDAKNVDTSYDIQKDDRSDDMMSYEACPGDGQGQWLLGGKSSIDEHFLHPCSMAEVKTEPMTQDEGQDIDNVTQVDGEEQAEGCDDMQECNALERITQANLLQAMEAAQMPYTSNICDQPSLEALATRDETNRMMVGPSTFGDAENRDVGHGSDIFHNGLGDNHRRMRVEAPWDNKPPDFDMCMDQLLQWAGKAKMAYVASREQAHQHDGMQQYYVNELGNKDRIIVQLKSGLEELKIRRQAELSRLENELYVMSGLIDGYRRALKDTQGAFAEYRKRFPQADEPIYRDAGAGGVVKSVMELEKERLRREEEERMLHSMVEDFAKHAEEKWESDMEGYHVQLEQMFDALAHLKEELNELWDSHARRKASETAHNE